MKILIADDDLFYRRLLETTVRQWDYEPITVCDGAAAWEVLAGPHAPALAILDWELPHCEGPELCRKARALDQARPLYAMVLTSRSDPADVIAGLKAGADDFLTKPFDRDELYARLQVGTRVVQLQQSLADKVRQLEDVMLRVKHLQGLLPICCYCKSIRDDQNYWRQVEHYLTDHSNARFSHGICPKCFKDVVEPEIRAAHEKSAERNPST
jgi:sigma-B regulation protein RsbU (phosphoserine phosphatase)